MGQGGNYTGSGAEQKVQVEQLTQERQRKGGQNVADTLLFPFRKAGDGLVAVFPELKKCQSPCAEGQGSCTKRKSTRAA